MHGTGKFLWNTGEVYEGEWQNGKKVINKF